MKIKTQDCGLSMKEKNKLPCVLVDQERNVFLINETSIQDEKIVQQIFKAITKRMSEEDFDVVVIDMRNVKYIISRFLGILLAL